MKKIAVICLCIMLVSGSGCDLNENHHDSNTGIDSLGNPSAEGEKNDTIHVQKEFNNTKDTVIR